MSKANGKTSEVVDKLDGGLRHKSGLGQNDFVKHYCKLFRAYAYATNDDSWNEFEKLITHVLGQYIYWLRMAEILKLPSDPREFVWAFDRAEEMHLEAQAENALQKLREILESVKCDETDAVMKSLADD